MKMTLDQLRVDSYATQVSETELTEIKGGTWVLCAFALLAAFVEAVHGDCDDPSNHEHIDPAWDLHAGGL